jgi:hypothetical protein
MLDDPNGDHGERDRPHAKRVAQAAIPLGAGKRLESAP